MELLEARLHLERLARLVAAMPGQPALRATSPPAERDGISLDDEKNHAQLVHLCLWMASLRAWMKRADVELMERTA